MNESNPKGVETMAEQEWIEQIRDIASRTFEGFNRNTAYIIMTDKRDVSFAAESRRPWPGKDVAYPEFESRTIDVPANIIEKLKLDRAPRWLRKLWPVRFKQAEMQFLAPRFIAVGMTLRKYIDQLSGLTVEMDYNAEHGVLAVRKALR